VLYTFQPPESQEVFLYRIISSTILNLKGAEMIDHDSLFKELLTGYFTDFLDTFLPEVLKYLSTKNLEFLDKELIDEEIFGDSRRVDVLVRASFKDTEAFFLIHTEHQAQAVAEFEKRMFEYFVRLYLKYEMPVYPIALLSYDEPKIVAPQSYKIEFPDRKVLEFNYAVIQLNRLNWQDYLNKPNPITSALMSKMQVAPEDRVKVKLECLDMMLGLKKLKPEQKQFLFNFVDNYLELLEPEKSEFKERVKKLAPKKQEESMKWMNSYVREGIAEGKKEGIAEGKKEGIAEGKQDLISRQLRHKVGELPAEIEAQVLVLPLEKLDALSEALLDFNTLADLETWLAAQAK
jgi:predicted transposase YdaD